MRRVSYIAGAGTCPGPFDIYLDVPPPEINSSTSMNATYTRGRACSVDALTSGWIGTNPLAGGQLTGTLSVVFDGTNFGLQANVTVVTPGLYEYVVELDTGFCASDPWCFAYPLCGSPWIVFVVNGIDIRMYGICAT